MKIILILAFLSILGYVWIGFLQLSPETYLLAASSGVVLGSFMLAYLFTLIVLILTYEAMVGVFKCIGDKRMEYVISDIEKNTEMLTLTRRKIENELQHS